VKGDYIPLNMITFSALVAVKPGAVACLISEYSL